MALVFILIAMLPGDPLETSMVAGFVIVGYAFVLIPLLISKGILRLASWESRRAHFWGMFVVTFVPMLSVYHFIEFEPDMSFAYEVNSGGTQIIEFAVTGALIAAFVGLLNAGCMMIYYRIAVRDNSS